MKKPQSFWLGNKIELALIALLFVAAKYGLDDFKKIASEAIQQRFKEKEYNDNIQH